MNIKILNRASVELLVLYSFEIYCGCAAASQINLFFFHTFYLHISTRFEWINTHDLTVTIDHLFGICTVFLNKLRSHCLQTLELNPNSNLHAVLHAPIIHST